MSVRTTRTESASPMTRTGGRRRIDRVLDDGFLSGLPEWTMAALRAKRADAEQEEVDLSYSRRLLHGRLDVLTAEQQTRQGGGRHLTEGSPDVVATLAGVLADTPAAPFGMGRHAVRSPSRAGEHRRAAEAAVADVEMSNPGALDDGALAAAIEQLTGLERQVGDARREVQTVLDALSAEVARRYRDGEANVDDVLGEAMHAS